jgi:hypothetical protein
VNPAAAVWQGFGISIAAQNCNSLNVVSSIKNQDLKISAILGYNSDILLLSDVRLNGRDKIISDKLKLSYSMHFNYSTNSRGVAVLIRNSLEHEIMERAADPQENILLLKMKIKGRELIIGTVYDPNDNVCEIFPSSYVVT